MITMAQRIEALRTERDLSRPALSTALGLPKYSAEKFETGRQTPTKDQQEALCAFFGVSLFYLRGESSDRTRQEDWIDTTYERGIEAPTPVPPPAPKKPSEPQGAVFDSLLASKGIQDMLRGLVLETLRSAEGQALIMKVVKKAGDAQ